MSEIKMILEQRAKKWDDFFVRINAYAKWLAFAKALAKIALIDWVTVANKMRDYCSDEAIAYGLWCCKIDLDTGLKSGIYEELEKLYDDYQGE